MSILVLTEKPSVAREIARVLGQSVKHDGYLAAGEFIVTWAVGHLVRLAAPEAYREEWKYWRIEQLPMMPEKFKLVVNKRTAKQFQVVRSWMTHPDIEKVIFATDAGPEGELIARWIYNKCNCRKPVERLWISSVTRQAIEDGLANLKPAEDYERLFQAAAARAKADWLVGLNATRAITCAARIVDSSSPTFTLGRVQTPTLRKVVDREHEIQNFIPETYYEVLAEFEDKNGLQYQGKWINLHTKNSRLTDPDLALKIVEQVQGQTTESLDIAQEEVVVPPPLLLSLSMLQQQASRRFGVSVADVTEAAQRLYEKGLITYPRTGDQLVTEDVAATFPHILDCLRERGHTLSSYIPVSPPDLRVNARYVGEIGDHHAIIPTGFLGRLNGLDEKVFDHIVQTFIAAHLPDGKDTHTQVITHIANHAFLSRETVILQPGWRVVYGKTLGTSSLGNVEIPVHVWKVEPHEEQTAPPPRYTEASLLREMERCRLGTPATRAQIIATLQKQQYITLDKQTIMATDKAGQLMQRLEDSLLTSVELTARWEEQFQQIQQGQLDVETFQQEIHGFVQQIVSDAQQSIPKDAVRHPGTVLGVCPKCSSGKVIRKEKAQEWFYGCSAYATGCRFFISGDICEAKITDKDILQLLKKGRIKKRFSFKQGKKVAYLVLKEDGSTSFDFDTSIVGKVSRLLFRSG